jgi:hypothetical protein
VVLIVGGEGVGGVGDVKVGYERTARAPLNPMNQGQYCREYDIPTFVL